MCNDGRGKILPQKVEDSRQYLLAVLILLAGGFFWYVSDYYRAEDAALDVLASGENIEVRGSLTILSPSYPTDTAIIFYPGAKVEGLPTCLCWTSCGGPASPVFWWKCLPHGHL